MNAPTLLIGLGGTGCKIIERVSRMVTDEQRANIAFAAFDTDINELREGYANGILMHEETQYSYPHRMNARELFQRLKS